LNKGERIISINLTPGRSVSIQPGVAGDEIIEAKII
jgi:hypothetical protein